MRLMPSIALAGILLFSNSLACFAAPTDDDLGESAEYTAGMLEPGLVRKLKADNSYLSLVAHYDRLIHGNFLTVKGPWPPLYQYARALAFSGEIPLSRIYFDYAIAFGAPLPERHLSRVYLSAGMHHLGRNDLSRARIAFEESCDRNPEPNARWQIAAAIKRSGDRTDHKASLAIYDLALDFDSSLGMAISNRFLAVCKSSDLSHEQIKYFLKLAKRYAN